MLRQIHVPGAMRRCKFSTFARILNETVTTPAVKQDPYAEIPLETCKLSGNRLENAVEDFNHGVHHYKKGQDELGLQDIEVSMDQYFNGDIHHTHKIFSGGQHNYKQGLRIEQRTFVDLRMVKLQTGNGGNGSVSFLRDAHRPVGPPDGGDGGDGGNIYVQVKSNISLLHKVKRTYVAGSGKAGASSQLDGKRGDDIILEVPVGTTMRWIPDPLLVRDQIRESRGDLSKVIMGVKASRNMDIQLFKDDYRPGEGWLFKDKDEEYHQEREYFTELNEQVKDYDREIIAGELIFDRFPLAGIDFDKPDDKPFLIVKGGKGGMGNMHFLTANVRNPRFSKKGRLGVCEHFLLELKLIADLGLVGLPNAGKLTLLRAILQARPRVGHWEFTTLQPTIGTIFTRIDEDPFTVADIPGIIKGASENRGMGMDFLRHIERSGGLVFVVSLESKDPVADLQLLIDEIGPRRMEGKRVMVIATKADLVKNAAGYKALLLFMEGNQRLWRCIPVCAPKGENINECIHMMGEVARSGDNTGAEKSL